MLNSKFFERNSVNVANNLIGCVLVIRANGKIEKFKIVETEAYEGLKDKASHASRGMTERNKIMFGKPGVWYVYFTYGMHYMLNIVCGKKGHPAAVLIRGISPPNPPLILRGGRKGKSDSKKEPQNLIGPARLTKKLKIDKKFNGKIANKKTGLWIEPPAPRSLAGQRIIKTPRVGVSYSGPVWSKKLYRFVLSDFETKKFKKA